MSTQNIPVNLINNHKQFVFFPHQNSLKIINHDPKQGYEIGLFSFKSYDKLNSCTF